MSFHRVGRHSQFCSVGHFILGVILFSVPVRDFQEVLVCNDHVVFRIPYCSERDVRFDSIAGARSVCFASGRPSHESVPRIPSCDFARNAGEGYLAVLLAGQALRPSRSGVVGHREHLHPCSLERHVQGILGLEVELRAVCLHPSLECISFFHGIVRFRDLRFGLEAICP